MRADEVEVGDHWTWVGYKRGCHYYPTWSAPVESVEVRDGSVWITAGRVTTAKHPAEGVPCVKRSTPKEKP